MLQSCRREANRVIILQPERSPINPQKNPPTETRRGIDFSLCYPHWGQTDRPVCLAVSARGSEPDVSFAKLFFLQRKAEGAVNIARNTGPRWGNCRTVRPACSRRAGARQTFLLPSFSFCKEKRSTFARFSAWSVVISASSTSSRLPSRKLSSLYIVMPILWSVTLP